MGADYIEPDLVSTKDGVLVARHENEISGTTDVADHPEFADRRTTKTIDGRPVTGWFTEDFTLAELQDAARQGAAAAVRPDNTRYDGRFEVPTLDEVLDLAAAESQAHGRTIGVYPETKHPTYFDSIGLSLEEPLVAALAGATTSTAPNAQVIIQSFETANLRELDRMTRSPLAQLVDASGAPYDLVAAGDPRTYRDLVDAGRPALDRDVRRRGRRQQGPGPAARRRRRDHRAVCAGGRRARGGPRRARLDGARREPVHGHELPQRGTDPNAKGDSYAEAKAFLDAGVDGIFSDQPRHHRRRHRDDWLAALLTRTADHAKPAT